MNAPASPPALRPLGIGELLDRAVNLCVRYLVPFSAIYLAYGVPLGFVNYFATANLTNLLEAFGDQLKAQGSGHPMDPHAMNAVFLNASNNSGWTVAVVLLAFFVSPLMTAALIDAIAESYLGRTPTFAGAYRTAAGRYPNLIGINILYLLAGGAVYLVIVIAAVAVIFALAAITAAAHVLGIVVGVVIGIVLFVAAFAFFLVVALAYQVSTFTCVVERANFVTSFTTGLARVFNGIGLKRSLLVGLCYIAVGLGISCVSSLGQGVLVGLLRSAIAGTIFTIVVSLVTAAFLTAFMAIFYFDLRVREEGLDLELAAQSVLGRSLEGT